ncbi:MAG: metallophosphoesterase [Terriglobia bacterium]
MHRLLHFAVSIRGVVSLSFLLFFVFSQIFWIVKLRRWKQRLVKNAIWNRVLGILGIVLYALLFIHGFGIRRTLSPTRLTVGAALLQAPFLWWLFGSTLGFAIYLLVRGCTLLVRGISWPFYHRRKRARGEPVRSPAIGQGDSPVRSLPDRREFFKKAATTLGAVPFVAGAYGVVYGRLNLKTTHQRIPLRRLPRAFEGFSILQLSDLHIGPFMTGTQIRRIVEISNHLRPDLIAVTGDYVTWDASTQYAVVDALSGLRAPYGVVGCLGNHEIYTHTEDSITRLFAGCDIHILRQAQKPIFIGQDYINLIGVDFQTHSHFGHAGRGHVRTYLEGVDRLMMPGTVNILMSHNPNTFDRAAELGIDLSLAGHTHGGQVALEFLSVDISPARLITPYVSGRFTKPGGQLYVNRGIGTIGFPIRLDAPPEITVYHLSR